MLSATSPASAVPIGAAFPDPYMVGVGEAGRALWNQGLQFVPKFPPFVLLASHTVARCEQKSRVETVASTSETELSDEALMDAYCAGDVVAFDALFIRFTDRLVRFLSNMVGRDKAKDLTQLTFMKIHENRHRYRAGASVPAWFFAIARNSALDYVRSAPKRREVYGLELDPGKDAPSFDRLRDERVRAAIEQLSADQQQVIQLHWFAELTFGEVAEAVGATPAAVRVRAHRGYEKLRGFLADLESEVSS